MRKVTVSLSDAFVGRMIGRVHLPLGSVIAYHPALKGKTPVEMDAAAYDAVTAYATAEAAYKNAAEGRSAAGRRSSGAAALRAISAAPRPTSAPAEKKRGLPAPKFKKLEAHPALTPNPIIDAAVASGDARDTLTKLQTAFDHFNQTLFSGGLPPVMLLIQRKRGAHGYFWDGVWRDRNGAEGLPEIVLNSDTMGRSTREVLSTLVHEMVHHEQHVYFKPGKVAHNKEWAELMDKVGLTPTSTGKEGGKRIGRSVTHMIVDGGPFDVSCAALQATGLELEWFTTAPAKRGPDKSKVKFTCPECDAKAWAKQDSALICGGCHREMT